MKSQGMFRAGSVALTVSMVILLSGCGVTQSGGTSTKLSSMPRHTNQPLTYSVPSQENVNFFQALNVADNFLFDWLHSDERNGVQLLSTAITKSISKRKLNLFFASSPKHEGFEILEYRQVSKKEFLFKVWIHVYVPGAIGYSSWKRGAPQILRVVEHAPYHWFIENLPTSWF